MWGRAARAAAPRQQRAMANFEHAGTKRVCAACAVRALCTHAASPPCLQHQLTGVAVVREWALVARQCVHAEMNDLRGGKAWSRRLSGSSTSGGGRGSNSMRCRTTGHSAAQHSTAQRSTHLDRVEYKLLADTANVAGAAVGRHKLWRRRARERTSLSGRTQPRRKEKTGSSACDSGRCRRDAGGQCLCAAAVT